MTNRTAALRYARALFDVALKEQADLGRIESELATFSELFTARPDLSKVLLNPAVPAPRKRAAVAEIVAHANPQPIVGKLMVLLAEREDAIRDSLARVTGQTVNLTATVNPSIIGGMVARVGSTVYDASVTTQLKKMRQQLAERM